MRTSGSARRHSPSGTGAPEPGGHAEGIETA